MCVQSPLKCRRCALRIDDWSDIDHRLTDSKGKKSIKSERRVEVMIWTYGLVGRIHIVRHLEDQIAKEQINKWNESNSWNNHRGRLSAQTGRESSDNIM